MPHPAYIIVHSFVPIEGRAAVGGFDWGYEGTEAEAQVRESFAVDTDAEHHDYIESHEHRLLRLVIPAQTDPKGVTDYIEEVLLDAIESGDLDGLHGTDLGRHLTTTDAP